MSGRIPNMVAVSGNVTRFALTKHGADTRHQRVRRLANATVRNGGRYFAMRWAGSWSIYNVPGSVHPIREGLTEDAAAMWLLHRSARI